MARRVICEGRQACKTEAAEGGAERLSAAHNPYAIDIFERTIPRFAKVPRVFYGRCAPALAPNRLKVMLPRAEYYSGASTNTKCPVLRRARSRSSSTNHKKAYSWVVPRNSAYFLAHSSPACFQGTLFGCNGRKIPVALINQGSRAIPSGPKERIDCCQEHLFTASLGTWDAHNNLCGRRPCSRAAE